MYVHIIYIYIHINIYIYTHICIYIWLTLLHKSSLSTRPIDTRHSISSKPNNAVSVCEHAFLHIKLKFIELVRAFLNDSILILRIVIASQLANKQIIGIAINLSCHAAHD